MKFNLEQIKQVLHNKNYIFFDKARAFDVNIISVRSSHNIPNCFDDQLYLIYRNDNMDMQIHEFAITTHPEAYWLEHPSNIDGTAILVPGQYRGSHAVGLHQGKYKALKQKRPLRIWRNNTLDPEIDKAGKIYEGIFGINIHRSNTNGSSKIVEKWSAGCQVFKNVNDFNFFMDVCQKSSYIYGNSFTYTLLEEDDFKPLKS